MSDHRSDRIRLDAAQPRCEPSGVCHMRSGCARYQAPIPNGGSLEDYTLHTAGGTALCDGYISINRAAVDAARPPAKSYIRGL